MRSLARETVFKFLYSQLFNPSDEGLFTVLAKELNDDDKSFAQNLIKIINENESEFLDKISQLSVGYKLNRIFATDKCALLIGMAELKGYPETAVAVVIDESVKLAAKYSTEKSTDFVNGILAEYAKEIR
ncbi:MAG: hypothetical protein IJZ73_06170 [Clostridia bacterium]|nr:hypothetical protein [Clostridia bacterium]